MTEYIIVGDTKDYAECLVYVCGGDRSVVEEYLQRILTNSTDTDKKITEGVNNPRLKSRACKSPY